MRGDVDRIGPTRDKPKTFVPTVKLTQHLFGRVLYLTRFLSDLVAAFYPHVHTHRLKASNITFTIEQKAYSFFRHWAVAKGGPRYHRNVTKELIEKYRRQIEATPVSKYADVYVDIKETVEKVAQIVEQWETANKMAQG